MSFAAQPFVRSAPGSIDLRNILSVCREGDTLNTPLLREMLGYFVDENRSRIAALGRALEASDRRALRDTAHSIRGSAAMLGAGRLHDLAWGLELDADDSDLDTLAGSVRAVRLEFETVVASLHDAHPDAVD
jgi:HPt (histidine-containing phosphotransfer) domain-containing protein